jgi:hypothetical protein
MNKMGRIIYALVCCSALIFSSCGQQSSSDTVSAQHIDPEHPPVMTFKDTLYDFGTISQGENVKYTFEFTNTGESDLVISSATASCGCTVPKNWPKHPVKPGETGKIDVNFNSENRKGQKDLTVTVLANTVPTKNFVYLKGFVAAPETTNE